VRLGRAICCLLCSAGKWNAARPPRRKRRKERRKAAPLSSRPDHRESESRRIRITGWEGAWNGPSLPRPLGTGPVSLRGYSASPRAGCQSPLARQDDDRLRQNAFPYTIGPWWPATVTQYVEMVAWWGLLLSVSVYVSFPVFAPQV
jgi:hypothetical protein